VGGRGGEDEGGCETGTTRGGVLIGSDIESKRFVLRRKNVVIVKMSVRVR